jgi:metallopeptidase MepB
MHSQVVTLFHELGHSMHNFVGRTNTAQFYGMTTARDFVEISSKMPEEWCWNVDILVNLSCHYTSSQALNSSQIEPRRKAPRELIEALVRTRNTTLVGTTLTQLYKSIYDFQIHSMSHEDLQTADLGNLFDTIRKDTTGLCGIKIDSEGGRKSQGQSIFSHLWQGYQTSYCCYPL